MLYEIIPTCLFFWIFDSRVNGDVLLSRSKPFFLSKRHTGFWIITGFIEKRSDVCNSCAVYTLFPNVVIRKPLVDLMRV